MARRVTIECCGICGKPVRQCDNGSYSDLARREGLLVEIGFSRGGWGRRDMGAGVWTKFSEEVCGECFDEAQALLRPVAEFLRGGRKEHHVSTVRDNVVEPERPRTSLLRALPFFR